MWKSLSCVRLHTWSPWNSPGQNTGVAIFSLLQGIFPTQELNPRLLHCRQTLYQLSHKGILFHPEEDHKLNEKIAFRMGWNIWKQCNWQGINLQNIQTAYEAQCIYIKSVQFSCSVAQLCLTLCDPMNQSTPGLPGHHQLTEFTQTHVHWVGDAIQQSHPLSFPSLPAPNPSKCQGFVQRVNSSHEVAKVLEFQLRHQSFQWTPRTDCL